VVSATDGAKRYWARGFPLPLLFYSPPAPSDINQPKSLDASQGYPVVNNVGVNRMDS
jgi:hypothetical protein